MTRRSPTNVAGIRVVYETSAEYARAFISGDEVTSRTLIRIDRNGATWTWRTEHESGVLRVGNKSQAWAWMRGQTRQILSPAAVK
jgi:hypothetical protein